jgi:hypothetical protein
MGADGAINEDTTFIPSQAVTMYRQAARILVTDVGADKTKTRLTILNVLMRQSARRNPSAATTPTTRAITGPNTHR